MRAAGGDPVNLDGPIPAESHLDECRPGDQIGVSGIADDEVADPLVVQADPVERVGRLDAAPLQLVLDDVLGNRLAPDPQDDERDDGEHQQEEQSDPRDLPHPAPAAVIVNDDRLDQAEVIGLSGQLLFLLVANAHPASNPLLPPTVPFPPQWRVARPIRFA